MNWTLHLGSALDVLKTLPDESVHCIVTSPPYFGLRDYGVDGQIGLEPTPDEYVAALVAVFGEARRVLRDDGCLFLNLGDSYANDGKWGGHSGGKHAYRGLEHQPIGRLKRYTGLKPKDLIGIPWLAAFALRADGWYLRADIVWSKLNPMPESVKDRVTKAHEYVFHLTKSARYFYNADAIREAYAPSTLREFETPYEGKARKDYEGAGVQNPSSLKARIVDKQVMGGANARSVWSIATQPSPYDHFAVMPKALARKCILAGCPQDGTVLDPFAGMATTGVVALEEGRSFVGIELNPKYHAAARQRLAGVAPLLAQEQTA